ncbi:hypothetical protein Taro_008161, partial [Colocasia esculenta]|nr:hypothetical protein [Colocasia esculenta]
GEHEEEIPITIAPIEGEHVVEQAAPTQGEGTTTNLQVDSFQDGLTTSSSDSEDQGPIEPDSRSVKKGKNVVPKVPLLTSTAHHSSRKKKLRVYTDFVIVVSTHPLLCVDTVPGSVDTRSSSQKTCLAVLDSVSTLPEVVSTLVTLPREPILPVLDSVSTHSVVVSIHFG